MNFRLNKIETKKLKNGLLGAFAIDNETEHEEKIVEYIQNLLKKNKISSKTDKLKNLFFKVRGKGEPILLCTHTDSVPPATNKKPKFYKGRFTSDGNTVLSADSLAGVVAILHTVKLLKKHKIPHRPLEVLFTSQEEISGIGASNFDFTQVKSKEAILPDLAKPVGYVITSAPTKYTFELVFHGVSGHIRNIEQSLSAIKVMADFLQTFSIGKVDRYTILNIGIIQGGTAINIIPDKVIMQGEIRSFRDENCAKYITKIQNRIEHAEKKFLLTKVDFKYEKVRSGYAIDPNSPFLEKYKKIIKSKRLSFRTEESLGVSDASILNAKGISTLLAGIGQKNPHTVRESIDLDQIVKMIEVLIDYVSILD